MEVWLSTEWLLGAAAIILGLIWFFFHWEE